MFLSLTLYLISLLFVIGLFLLSLNLDETLGQTYDIYGNLAGTESAIFFFIGLGILITFYRLRESIINTLVLILTGLLIALYYCLRRCFYYFLLLVCSPIYPLFIVLLGSFDDLAGLFSNFIPTVSCEGVVDPFPVVQQFTDLSSLDTQTIIKEAYSEVSGIYMFQCTETGGTYIGSSVDLYGRFYAHLNDISSNLNLQNAANKYGWDSFIFRIIETCLPTELITREQFNLDILFNNFSKELVYNFCAIAYSMLGYIHTYEAKAAISEAIKGNTHALGNTSRLGATHTAEAKAAIGAARLGTTHTAEAKAAIGAARLGTTHTAETKAAIRAARLGTTHTAEAKAAIGAANSQALLGNTNASRGPIFVYLHETPEKLVGEYTSLFEASKSLEIPYTTLRRYLANGKVWNNKYIIRSSRLY